MLISEFARRTALSVDTVRYYVRAGLMTPQQGTRGGRNPYQEFSEADIRVADVIRFGQALGMSLKEISAVLHLRARGEDLLRLARYLDEKIEWINAGSHGDPPELEHPSLKYAAADGCD